MNQKIDVCIKISIKDQEIEICINRPQYELVVSVEEKSWEIYNHLKNEISNKNLIDKKEGGELMKI